MGALGARRVSELMTRAGLSPVELERYSCSNKIWSSKVKRLRLPDLLCVRTGLRVEVRAKSKLTIKMSDAPTNPDRRWNSGLVDRDMVAFVLIREGVDGALDPAANAELFWVEDLVATEGQSRLEPPKSASEGAERDREWPATVPSADGVVQDVAEERISVRFANGRNQTYQLRGKTAYLAPAEAFLAESQFLAGIPAAKAHFPNPEQARWNPRAILTSASPIDRYVAVKALGVVGNNTDRERLFALATNEPEGRVALEASASLARLGDLRGLESVQRFIDNPPLEHLRMEAILILSELRGTPLAAQCANLLAECASSQAFAGNEVRQAAIWGLGKDGLRAYDRLLGFLGGQDNDELVHAVCAFGPDAGVDEADALGAILLNPASSERQRASASFLLAKTVPPAVSIPWLVAHQKHAERHAQNWIIATLGQMSPTATRTYVTDPVLSSQLECLHLTAPETNWTRAERGADMLSFVRKQSITLI